MKNPLLLTFLIGFISISQSYGQQPTGIDTIITSQVILRDSDGNLITYLDVQKLEYLNVKGLAEFLDYESAIGNDLVFTYDETNYQLIKRTATYTFDSQTVMSGTTLNDLQDGKEIKLVRTLHDGIPVNAGDKLTTVWTFIRPV